MAPRRLACNVLLPVTPPPCAQCKIRKIRKLGSRQTPSKRSMDLHKDKNGKKRGLMFHWRSRRNQRPKFLSQHLRQHLSLWIQSRRPWKLKPQRRVKSLLRPLQPEQNQQLASQYG